MPKPAHASSSSTAPAIGLSDEQDKTVEEAAAENVADPIVEDTPAKVDPENEVPAADTNPEAGMGEPAVTIGEGGDAPQSATEDSEMASAATPAPEEAAEDATMTEVTDAGAAPPTSIEEAGSVQIQQVALPEKPEGGDDEAAPAAAVEQEEEQAPPEPLAKKFSLFFAGNKYNPQNYWYVQMSEYALTRS